MAKANRFKQNDNKNAICYYRYSDKVQRDVSIEQQQEAARKFASEKGLHIIKEYADRAISGTRKDRPAFQRMLLEAEKLRPAYLIVWKTDRFSRDRFDAVRAKGHLRECGVRIEYIAEPMPEDEGARIILESIEEAIAEQFIINHSQNVVRGLKYNAENALYNGRVRLGYKGERNKRYEVDPATAPVVKKIYREYADGVPMQKIADELNNAGIRTTKGGRFSVNSLRWILQNEAYLGIYKWGDIAVEDGLPAIIDRALFDDVQKRLAKNRRGGRPAAKPKAEDDKDIDYWLTGHIYCGKCGGTMNGMSGTSKTGKTYYYYTCQAHRKRNGRCPKKNVRKERVESIVAYAMRTLLDDGALILLIADRCYQYYQQQNETEDYEYAILADIKEVERKLENILRAIEDGIYNDTTQKRMEELEAQNELLHKELEAERGRQKLLITPEQIVRYLNGFKEKIDGETGDDAMRERLLEMMVDKIHVYDDKVVITFYFTENREYQFDEVEQRQKTLQRILRIMETPKDTGTGGWDFFG